MCIRDSRYVLRDLPDGQGGFVSSGFGPGYEIPNHTDMMKFATVLELGAFTVFLLVPFLVSRGMLLLLPGLRNWIWLGAAVWFVVLSAIAIVRMKPHVSQQFLPMVVMASGGFALPFGLLRVMSGYWNIGLSSATDAPKSPARWSVANPLGIVTVVLCLLYTSPSPRDATLSRMPSSA